MCGPEKSTAKKLSWVGVAGFWHGMYGVWRGMSGVWCDLDGMDGVWFGFGVLKETTAKKLRNISPRKQATTGPEKIRVCKYGFRR